MRKRGGPNKVELLRRAERKAAAAERDRQPVVPRSGRHPLDDFLRGQFKRGADLETCIINLLRSDLDMSRENVRGFADLLARERNFKQKPEQKRIFEARQLLRSTEISKHLADEDGVTVNEAENCLAELHRCDVGTFRQRLKRARRLLRDAGLLDSFLKEIENDCKFFEGMADVFPWKATQWLLPWRDGN
jgi:hypothetical protein